MLQLVYVSVAWIGLDAGAFEALLDLSRARNRADGITGLLVYDGMRLLQAIEGADAHVERCFERIMRDPRHSQIEIHALRRIEDRVFGTWDLQFHRLDGGFNPSAIAFIEEITKKSTASTRDFVREFCGLKRRAA